MTQYIDISQTLDEKTPVFPGDIRFQRTTHLSFKKGHHLELSDIQTTLHIGAHADAPCHYHPEGISIDQVDLNAYIGPCQVISIKIPRGDRITLKHFLEAKTKITAPRILFKTGSCPDPDKWNDDFNSLSAELIEYLSSKENVLLVGIDTPSVDPSTDKELSSHQALYKTKMAVLEGLVLAHVAPANYQLIALPLKIKNADGAPVRAVLLPYDTNNQLGLKK